MTRRLAPAGAIALLLAAQTADQPAREITDPGVVTTRQTITPAGVPSTFQGRVYGVAFGATPSEIWVLASGGVYRLDWQANQVKQRVPLAGGAAGLQGLRYDAAGKRALAAVAAKDKSVKLLEVGVDGARDAATALGTQIAGSLALAGKFALVPLIYDNKLAVVDLTTGQTRQTAQSGIAPFAVASDGVAAWVSNWGGRPPSPRDLTAPTGLAKNADRVVIDKFGKASTGTVVRIDLASGTVTHTIATGLHPTALAFDSTRRVLYVANNNDDSITVIDTAKNAAGKTWPLRPFQENAIGLAPTALALAPDGPKLYVACGGINAVAVVDTATGAVDGLIPTAWYPNALDVSADGKQIAVATLLGAGSGWRDEPKQRYVHANRGSVAVFPVPDAAQLAGYSTAVARNTHMTLGVPATPARAAARKVDIRAIPERAGDPSFIEHVVYIVKENRTYDQVFGSIGRGNSDPSLTMFGRDVTPNHHRIAEQFVLLDNFYATGGNSGDGHQWLTQANETAYAMWPGWAGRSYPFDGTDPIAYAKGNFIWDAAVARKKSVRVYGEFAPRANEGSGASRQELLERWRKGETFPSRWNTTSPLPSLDPLLARNFPGYSTGIPDVIRADLFVADLKQWTADGGMPNLVLIQLPSDHTRGTAPGASTPKAMVADNDLALGKIVEALTKSPFWKSMAIFVVEDDAQNGVDHVDGHRTVALVASPFARRGHVDSTFYSHPSILKTIELILGLPTMSLFDLIANDMRASFDDTPDFAVYTAVEPRQSLLELNPPLNGLRGEERRAALESMKMRFDTPDAAPTERLNRILWGAVRGWRAKYPGVRQSVFAPLSLDLDDDER